MFNASSSNFIIKKKIGRGMEKNINKKLLLLDNNDDFSDMLQLFLEKEGYDFITVNRKQFENNIYDDGTDLLLIHDLSPGIIELFTKSDLNFEKLKIILITQERFNEREKKRLLDVMNVVDFIPNPSDLEKIQDIINKHI